ncbi:hypothetical protein PQI66_01940 [Corynebacterium sp. USCH3]|uniref:hypothetical protein n=1 Tax=Corynebacterium sp. USCH3 TaxID=3024840 RepID=UPI0030A751F6
MSTTSVRRRSVVHRPVYRRPQWSAVDEASRSNTWGHGATRHPSAVQVARRAHSQGREERPFESVPRRLRMRRRMSSVVGSPGVTLLSLASLVLMLAASPALTDHAVEPVTPSGTATVTVDDSATLADIARQHVPGASVGDAVARIASLNDVTGIGDASGRPSGVPSTRDVVVPVY